jgi:protein FRA10AC1
MRASPGNEKFSCIFSRRERTDSRTVRCTFDQPSRCLLFLMPSHHHVTMSAPLRHMKRSPPRSSLEDQQQPRKICNVISALDHDELKRHYMFVPEADSTTCTWQQRMVNHYHSHLYKEYVLADLSRPGQVGLRWRTEQEVQNGRGHATCGNKHCGHGPGSPQSSSSVLLATYYQSSLPSSGEEERRLLEKIPHGLGLHDYEVPFTYTEHGQNKTELVKLRLCLRCAPLLFASRGGEGVLEARKARAKNKRDRDPSPKDLLPDSGESSDDQKRKARRRRSKHKKRKKNRKEG